MGNACGCNEDKRTGEAVKSTINKILNKESTPALAQYKVPSFISKINSSYFAGLTPQEKDNLLAEAFKVLVTTVEPSKYDSVKNSNLKKLVEKTVGKVVNENGEVYEGELIDGVANGKGKITSPDGSTYEGMVFNGLRHGQGKVTVKTPEARSYTCDFYQNIPIGPVTQKLDITDGDQGVLEGGFDTKGLESGPYLMKYNDGDSAYFFQKDGKAEGLHVLISKEKNTLVVTEFKGGNETKPGLLFAARTETQK